MADETVFVVDDEVGMVTLLRNYLTREGYEVHTAPSGETALQFLEEHDCDVVLTDLRMGGMDGLALVRAIHATRPETPVILMTAFGGIDTAIEAVKGKVREAQSVLERKQGLRDLQISKEEIAGAKALVDSTQAVLRGVPT